MGVKSKAWRGYLAHSLYTLIAFGFAGLLCQASYVSCLRGAPDWDNSTPCTFEYLCTDDDRRDVTREQRMYKGFSTVHGQLSLRLEL